MTDTAELTDLRQMIKQKCGVILETDSHLFLQTRLHSFLLFHQIKDLTELSSHLKIYPEHFDEVIDLVTTHESLFFRDDSFFKTFEEQVLPYFFEARRQDRRLRIWSAACAHGQEPYSVAMCILNHKLNFSDWNIEILATDISKNATAKARKGVYTHFEVQRGLSLLQLSENFEKSEEGWKILDKISRLVRFENINLIEPFLQKSSFDIVFIRNVLIYFDTETKQRILAGISSLLPSDGCLGLGGPETILGLSQNFEAWDKNTSSLYRVKKI